MIAGLLCGGSPFAVALVSGILGLYIMSNDLAYVRWVIAHGAPVPYEGTIAWPRFGWLFLLGLGAGVATMLALGLLQRAILGLRRT